MGFGLLFIGYAVAFFMSLNSFGIFFRLLGTAIMTYSLSKLKDFEASFRFSMYISAALLMISLAETVFSDIQIVFYVVAIAFHLLLFRAIGKLASSLELQHIVIKCIRYGIFVLIEIGVIIGAAVFWYLKMTVAKYLLMAAVILPYIIFALDLMLIYSCYKNICEEGYEDLPRKPSKIPFVNKLLDARDKREEEIFSKTKSYVESKIWQDNEKKKNKKKKK